jgi:hypothetical protein
MCYVHIEFSYLMYALGSWYLGDHMGEYLAGRKHGSIISASLFFLYTNTNLFHCYFSRCRFQFLINTPISTFGPAGPDSRSVFFFQIKGYACFPYLSVRASLFCWAFFACTCQRYFGTLLILRNTFDF